MSGKLGPFRLPTKPPHWQGKKGNGERRTVYLVYPETTWYYAAIGDKKVSEFTTTWWSEKLVKFNGKRAYIITKDRRFSMNREEVAKWLMARWHEATTKAYREYLETAKIEKSVAEKMRPFLTEDES